MKITELRCSACDGTLKIDENNPNYAECEYCHTRYSIEWDRPGAHGAPGSGDPHLRELPPAKLPPQIRVQPLDEPLRDNKTGWEAYGWKRCVAAFVIMFVGVLAVNGPELYRSFQKNQEETASAVPDSLVSTAGGRQEGTAEKTAGGSLQPEGILADFLELVYGKPVEEITGQELEKIKRLEFQTDLDYRKIGYSFEDQTLNPEAELTWVKFERDACEEADLSCLPLFSGLQMLGTSQSLTPEKLKGLSLTGLRGYFDNMEEIAALVEDPSQLKRIETYATAFSMQGLEQLPNLETLIINSDQIDETKLLAGAKAIKNISVDMYDGSMDFSVFGMMPWLESLTISSKSLKDIGFVSKLESLKELNLEYGTFLNLEPLNGRTGLETLSIVSCDDLKDLSAAATLTSLKKLKLDLPYDCPAPDLSGLTAIEELYLEGFDQIGFLKHMGGLTRLTLDGCRMENESDFDGLVNLKYLKCTAFSATDRDYGFITRLSALEEADLHGMSTYDDISGIFNMPSLKRMDISSMECEIDFDKINENTTLEELSIDSIRLYENVSVTGGGGIYSVNWDDVSFTEHLSFFEKLKGLKKLSIRENELTDISFAASLEALQEIDFSDNYVTDLSPLTGLKALSRVVCVENPISNYEVLGESVAVVK